MSKKPTPKVNDSGKRRSYHMLSFNIFVGILAVSLLMSLLVSPLKLPGGTLNIGILMLMFTTFYLVVSFRFWDPVQPHQRAALLFFGRPFVNVGSGPVFAPPGIVTVVTVPRNILQREFPAEPQLIYRDEKKTVPEELRTMGYKPPIRVTFGTDISDDDARKAFGTNFTAAPLGGKPGVDFNPKTDEGGLSHRVTAEPSFIVSFRITNPTSFIENLVSEEEVFRQIEDSLTNLLTAYYSKMSLAQALANINWMSILLFNRAIERLIPREYGRDELSTQDWGISLETVLVKFIHLDHGLNTAISQTARAPFEATKVEIEARADAIRITTEGEANAKVERDLLTARGEGLKAMAKSIGTSGESVQAAEVAREVAKGGNTIVVGTGGMSELAGLAAAAANIVQKQRSADKDETSGDTSPDEPSEENESKGN